MNQCDTAYDGLFFAAIRATGIFCQPSCRPLHPIPPNGREFFASASDCMEAGYSPCSRCHPLSGNVPPPEWLTPLTKAVQTSTEPQWTERMIAERGLNPDRVQRWLKTNLGLTLAQWVQAQKSAGHSGPALPSDDMGFADLGEAQRTLQEVVSRAAGHQLNQLPSASLLHCEVVESPLGTLLNAATDAGICLCSYTGPASLAKTVESLLKRHRSHAAQGENRHLVQLKRELEEYFSGRRREFTLPLVPAGTDFQQEVWAELVRIPYNQTISYEEESRRIGKPDAIRAVAQANGSNPIAIVIPCHRVVGKSGTLTGYGGGLWRKRLLLALERDGVLP